MDDCNLTLSETTLDDDNRSCLADYQTNHTISHNRSNTLEILKITAVTFYSIIFILGIIGNGLVIWIAGFRMKKTISAPWFLHLAIADFLCCASIPLLIADWASNDVCSTSISSEIFCIVNVFLFYVNMSASVLLLTAMSIDRWVSVMWPFFAKVHRTRKRVRITAGIIWVLSLIWTGLMFIQLVFYYNINNTTTRTIRLIRLVIMFVIPFLIIFTSYVTIYIKLRTSKRPPRSQRPYRIITAVVLCFFICWAPYYVLPLTSVYYEDLIPFLIIDISINCLVYLNSCINPIIYVFMARDFSYGFLRSIPFRLEQALSEHPDEPCGEREDHEITPTTDI